MKIITLKTNIRVFLTGNPTLEICSNQLLQFNDEKWPVSIADGNITFPLNFCNIIKTIDI